MKPESSARRDPPYEGVRRPGAAAQSDSMRRGPGAWLVAAFAAGFSLLALEVIWFRFLLLFVMINLVVDLVYVLLDPRLQRAGSA